MAGHSHWKQIKEHKGSADVKRGAVFSKLLRAISAAARDDNNPDFNPRLRSAIQKAKEFNVPQENIERAIKKASNETALEEVIMEAYGPGGAALMILGLTNNKNRTTNEVKNILKDFEAKWAEPGSVRWAFESTQNENGISWQAKFKQEITTEEKNNLEKLVVALEEHEDVVNVFTNVL
ncbi:MAG: YebC/PmpR family DNA-binding transcriptional regulator [Patescibacteria group bacterium]